MARSATCRGLNVQGVTEDTLPAMAISKQPTSFSATKERRLDQLLSEHARSLDNGGLALLTVYLSENHNVPILWLF